MKTAYRWKSLIDAAIETIASSDSPVEPPDTLQGIRTLVMRDGLADGEALKESEAVRLYSRAGAKLDGQMAERGTLEIGKLADLTILTKPVLDAGSRVKAVLLRGSVLNSESGSLG